MRLGPKETNVKAMLLCFGYKEVWEYSCFLGFRKGFFLKVESIKEVSSH